jgi:drug/metabolite transporter (DMT)-like permease
MGTRDHERASSKVYLGVTAAIVAMASSSVIITLLERSGVAPITIAFYRMALTAAILTPVALALRRTEILSLARNNVWLVVSSGFCLAVHFAAWIASLKYLPISTSVVLVSSHPFLVVLASRLFLNERPARRSLLGICIGFCGTAIVCWTGLKDLGGTLTGDALALLGAVAVVGYVIIGRRIRARVSLLTYVTPVYLICSLFLLAAVAALGARLHPYSGTDWLHFGFLALVPTIFGHTVLNWALRYVRASVVSVAFLGEPVAASLFGFILLAQVPSWSTFLGGILVLAGIYVSTTNVTND